MIWDELGPWWVSWQVRTTVGDRVWVCLLRGKEERKEGRERQREVEGGLRERERERGRDLLA